LEAFKGDISTATDVKLGKLSITSGEMYSSISSSYLTVNGAQPIRNSKGVAVGFTIPAGQVAKRPMSLHLYQLGRTLSPN
jgi:hypothetical protein